MARLRGHHLICLFFFEGDIDQEAFEHERKHVLGQGEAGDPIEIVEGADDLCSCCRHLADGRCAINPGADVEITRLDRSALEGLGISVGESRSWSDVASRVVDIPGRWFSRFCEGCTWIGRCRMGAFKR